MSELKFIKTLCTQSEMEKRNKIAQMQFLDLRNSTKSTDISTVLLAEEKK